MAIARIVHGAPAASTTSNTRASWRTLMRKHPIRTLLVATITALSLCAQAPMARGAFPELAQRVPADANAIVAVNVARLVQSDYGKKAEWGQRMAETWEKQPMMIPPGSIRLLM
jgi:hypothetical protein